MAAIILTGCASTGARQVVAVKDAERTPPADAMQACGRVVVDDQSFGAIVRALGDALDELNKCSQKRDELHDFIENK